MSTGPGAYPPPEDPQYRQNPPPGGYRPPPMRHEDEKLWAMGAHLGPLFLSVVAPLVVWLVFKDRSAYLDREAKEALNMQLSYLVYGVVAAFSLLILVGVVLVPLVGIAWLVFMIIATVKVADDEDYRYPWIFRLVS